MKKVRNGFVKNLHYLCLAGVIALGFITIVATGGGGGGSSSSSGGTGSVAVFLTDDPADEYDKLWITITEVTLIPAAYSGTAPAVVYSSTEGCQVDLLEYRNEDFLLTIQHGIPAGTYEKIRLGIRDVVPVGGPCDEMEVKLPSGKIDLVPRGTFKVERGETLGIQLDIDANKSINLHTAGQSGMCIFRPVVFVDIGPIEWMPRCPKIVKGTLEKFIGEDGLQGFRLALFPKSRGTLDVYVSDTTVIFNELGLKGDFGDLEEGQTVWVRGRLDGNGHFQATEVAIGELLVLKGAVESTVDDDTFTFALDPNQPVTDETIPVRLSDKTLILVGCDDEVSKEAIQPGLPAWVSGKLSLDEQMLQAVAVFLKPISGEVISVTEGVEHNSIYGIALTIRVNGYTDVVVFVPESAPIRLVGDGDVPVELLCPGRQVYAVIDPDTEEPSVLTASEIKVQPDHLVGYVDTMDEAKRNIFIGGLQLLVQDDAVIMDLRGKEDRLRNFDFITSGDKVSCFGLEACEADTTGNDFYAFVILLIED